MQNIILCATLKQIYNFLENTENSGELNIED